MKILLVGNYEPDGQESMTRFALLMQQGLARAGIDASILRPALRWGGSTGSTRKWRAYVDKFILFRSQFRREIAGADLLHICDHSNAMYAAWAAPKPVIVTCHDLLAVRGALGEDTDCPASPMGRVLQRWIVQGLRRARAVVCDSHATQQDFERIVRNGSVSPTTSVVGLCLNDSFQKMPQDEAWRVLHAATSGIREPFLLHVGSSLRRKNREAVLRTLSNLETRHAACVVFAGAPLNDEQRAMAAKLGVANRVVEVLKPSNELLQALYAAARCLLFPSRFEGFGWPVLEAQACGCPVITSSTSSLPEVAGEGAILCDADNEEQLAAAVVALQEPARRRELIELGAQNVSRFTEARMIEGYVNVYRQVLSA